MNKLKITLIISVLSIISAIAGFQFYQKVKPNDYRPAFELPSIQGKIRDISEWDGQVIVLNFWATWCPPCLKEMPMFNDIQKKYQHKGVQFIGVAIDEWPKVKSFVEKMPMSYPILVELNGFDILIQYGNAMGVLPFTVFIDREGNIISRNAKLLTQELVEKELSALL